MVTNTVTAAQHSTNNQKEGSHGGSSPPSNGSSNDHWALIEVLTPHLILGSQFSVLVGDNIRVNHLVTTANSSVSNRTPNKCNSVFGVPKPPSNGSKLLRLGAGAT
mgnify:FL=1